MTAETASQPTRDEDVILPETQEIEIKGIRAEVRRLKTREFLALMKVLLRGIGGDLVTIFQETDEKKLQGKLVGALLVAIPEAEHEFMMFLQKVVVAVDQKERKALMGHLDNPEIGEMLEIARVIIEQEVDDFARLGKEAKAWWGTVRSSLRLDG